MSGFIKFPWCVSLLVSFSSSWASGLPPEAHFVPKWRPTPVLTYMISTFAPGFWKAVAHGLHVCTVSSTGEAAAFDDEWRRETSRFRQQRPLEFRRHEASVGGGRRAEGPPRLAIQGPEDSPSRQSRRYDW